MLYYIYSCWNSTIPFVELNMLKSCVSSLTSFSCWFSPQFHLLKSKTWCRYILFFWPAKSGVLVQSSCLLFESPVLPAHFLFLVLPCHAFVGLITHYFYIWYLVMYQRMYQIKSISQLIFVFGFNISCFYSHAFMTIFVFLNGGFLK